MLEVLPFCSNYLSSYYFYFSCWISACVVVVLQSEEGRFIYIPAYYIKAWHSETLLADKFENAELILSCIQVQTALAEQQIKYRSPLRRQMIVSSLFQVLGYFFNEFYPSCFSCKCLKPPVFFCLARYFYSTHIFPFITTATGLHKNDRLKTFLVLSAHQPANPVRYERKYLKHLLKDNRSRGIVHGQMHAMLPAPCENLPKMQTSPWFSTAGTNQVGSQSALFVM